MAEKFLRCFAHGLAEGEEIIATIEGVAVIFTSENAQIDVPIAPTESDDFKPENLEP